jgi:glycine/serine hydroxymethyltransferase
MKEPQMKQVASWIVDALRSPADEKKLRDIHEQVRALCRQFPVPGLDS